MTAPITETFDDVVLSGDGDGDDTRSFGGSPRTINDWTIRADTVRSYINWTLADNVERLELAQSSSANLSGTGPTRSTTL